MPKTAHPPAQESAREALPNAPLPVSDDAGSGTPPAPASHTRKQRSKQRFPIVGIGASAGGLDALTRLVVNIPVASGMAYVIVQHLDPNHVDAMPALLQRHTNMPVAQAKNRMKVWPDHVYVIPPAKDLSILNGRLYLLDPAEKRGLRLPVDFFFRSLAADVGDRAIGIILSGMGSDGSLGLRAIKEVSGITLAQSIESAAFSGMPKSVIDLGLADIVTTPEEMPAKIAGFFANAPDHGRVEHNQPALRSEGNALEQIIILLRERTGNDFSCYKKNTLYRRIERRMALHEIRGISAYASYLRETPEEADLLFNEFLIGVTNFFRDPTAWSALIATALPALLSVRTPGETLRAWVPACSTGEEAYSLAIAFREALVQSKLADQFTLQIFATDIDSSAIERARRGLYPANIAADVSADRLANWFIDEDKGYRVKVSIRDMVIFAQQNVIADPPFTRLDILVCRNFLIYLSPELQKRLLPMFHYALNYHGILMLGTSESIGRSTQLFSVIDSPARLYQRLEYSPQRGDIDYSSGFHDYLHTTQVPAPFAYPPRTNGSARGGRRGQRYSAAILADENNALLNVSGHPERYLGTSILAPGFQLSSMPGSKLHDAMMAALKTARQQHTVVELRGVQIGSLADSQTVDISVRPLGARETKHTNCLIVFSDVVSLPASRVPSGRASPATDRRLFKRSANESHEGEESGRIGEMLDALEQAHLELQALREQTQSSEEALKATNEELLSANEELQSTNEELTTSKEEMQSLNEELQTVNAELQAKVVEMAAITGDMENLLDSTEAATIFLDANLNIRRFTPFAKRLFKLLPVDIGRPLSDIVSELDYPQLLGDAATVLKTLEASEKSVFSRGGRCFNVKVMPYRNVKSLIDGVVIAFIETSEATAQSRTLAEIERIVHSTLSLLASHQGDAGVSEAALRKVSRTLALRSATPSMQSEPDEASP